MVDPIEAIIGNHLISLVLVVINFTLNVTFICWLKIVSVDSKIIRITGLCLFFILFSTSGKDLKGSSFIVVLEVRIVKDARLLGGGYFIKLRFKWIIIFRPCPCSVFQLTHFRLPLQLAVLLFHWNFLVNSQPLTVLGTFLA